MSMENALFAFVFAVVLYFMYEYLKKEDFVNSPGEYVQFLTAEQTGQFLLADADFFMANLSPTDLYARNVKLAADYKHRAARAATDFTTPQKLRLVEAAKAADRFLMQANVKGIDCAKMSSIPWVIGITEGSVYEDGLPHTRANVIFLSTETDETPHHLMKTLVHEKVHLYTRLYPEETAYYLESNGYLKWKQRLGVPRIRANPDLDAWIYIDPKTQKPMAMYYTSDKPESINDTIQTNAAFEHPYELMAYAIQSKFKE